VVFSNLFCERCGRIYCGTVFEIRSIQQPPRPEFRRLIIWGAPILLKRAEKEKRANPCQQSASLVQRLASVVSACRMKLVSEAFGDRGRTPAQRLVRDSSGASGSKPWERLVNSSGLSEVVWRPPLRFIALRNECCILVRLETCQQGERSADYCDFLDRSPQRYQYSGRTIFVRISGVHLQMSGTSTYV